MRTDEHVGRDAEAHGHVTAGPEADTYLARRLSIRTPPGSWRMVLVVSGVALLTAVLVIAAASTLGLTAQQPSDTGAAGSKAREQDRTAALGVATAQAELLAGLSADNVETALDQLAITSTGRWAEQLRADPAGITAGLMDGGVLAVADVRTSALARIDDTSAVVLVAAFSTVSQQGAARSSARTLNLRFELSRVGRAAPDRGAGEGAGTWLVSDVEVLA